MSLAAASAPTTAAHREPTRELSPRAMFVYFDALAKGVSRAEAERLADAVAAPRPALRVCFDVAWRMGGRERARRLVAAWFEQHPDAGHFFTDEACVCVALKPAEASRFVRDLAALDRSPGEPLAIARVVRQGPVACHAFGPRARHAFAA